DFPQQQQMVEIVDNRDGTMSIFTTVVDHASDPVWREGDFSQTGLASLSRQLASNDFTENPMMRRGGDDDRNTELLLPAPFDLSAITEAEIERLQNESRAGFLRRQGGGAQ
ncbi:MAG TPA: TIGR03767 family metallophosphoesterase, partial [Actinomycetota bacterium]|nr:TIGR03767 family metallophosphoesterase [Actinomycetota bacterium]